MFYNEVSDSAQHVVSSFYVLKPAGTINALSQRQANGPFWLPCFSLVLLRPGFLVVFSTHSTLRAIFLGLPGSEQWFFCGVTFWHLVQIICIFKGKTRL